jgi:hypothetical protein
MSEDVDMSGWVLAVVLAQAAEPVSTVTAEFDGVCGSSCVALIRAAVLKIDGVREIETIGDKSHFQIVFLESKKLLPSAIVKAMDAIQEETKGDSEFPLLSFVVDSMAGTIRKRDGKAEFAARGSGQVYALRDNDVLKKRLEAGEGDAVVSGKVVEEPAKDGAKPLPVLELETAK